MNFLKLAEKGQGNGSTYMLTVVIVFFSLVAGQLFAEIIAAKQLGFSLTNIPQNADLNLVLTLLLIPFAFVFFAVLMCVKYLFKRPILTIFTARASFDWKRFFTSFGIWGAVLAIALIIGIATGQPVDWNFDPITFFLLLLISIFLIPIQTTAEELMFRGFLLQTFGKIFKKGWIPVLLTATLFGFLHWANPEVALIGNILLLYYIGTGVFLALLAVWDDGMELPMGYHAVNNIFASVILTNDWQAFHTDALFIDCSGPVFGWESWLTLIVLQPMLLLLFAKMYKWKNIKSKLL
ncbi:MAG: type II CAAX endopeptidase family protein [Crocinitomicaceae bacterium]